jgi:transcription elongation factor Elf1
MDINIDMNIDEDEFKQAIAEQMDEVVKDYLETKAQKGHFECPSCGNEVFDIETWETQGDIRAAGVCRECNERTPIDVDMSDIDALK